MRTLRLFLLPSFVVAICLAPLPLVASQCDRQPPVQIQAIGHPGWKPVDFHVFTAQDADFVGEMKNLLYPLRHQWCDDLGVGPGDPHQPPYIHEFEGNLDIVNLKGAEVFRAAEFSPPNGVFAVWMTVPDPGTRGSSPDFHSGPIIPNSLFPIHLVGQTFRNNQLWDPYLGTFDIPALAGQLPHCTWLNFDGHSHFPVIYAEDASYGPGGPIQGHYELRITMTDTTGNGWSIVVHFTVL